MHVSNHVIKVSPNTTVSVNNSEKQLKIKLDKTISVFDIESILTNFLRRIVDIYNKVFKFIQKAI